MVEAVGFVVVGAGKGSGKAVNGLLAVADGVVFVGAVVVGNACVACLGELATGVVRPAVGGAGCGGKGER